MNQNGEEEKKAEDTLPEIQVSSAGIKHKSKSSNFPYNSCALVLVLLLLSLFLLTLSAQAKFSQNDPLKSLILIILSSFIFFLSLIFFIKVLMLSYFPGLRRFIVLEEIASL